MHTVQHDPDGAHLRRRQHAPRVAPVTRASRAARVARDIQPGEAAPGRRREARPEAAAPWQYAKHLSAHLDPGADLRNLRRHVREAQREVLWRESRLERVRNCGRVPLLDAVTVRDNAGVAHFTGLESCGSVHACPVCQPKILNRRATEISEATAAWDRAGNTVLMITLTFPHDMGMRLKALLPVVATGFSAVISGRPWRRVRDQLGIVGTIRSLEVTHGENGWHPHAHVLVYVRGELDAAGIAPLTLYVREKWASWITGQGYRVPHEHHGVDVAVCSSAAEAGLYIAKTQDGRSVGNEVARGDLKQGRAGSRTPLEVLDDFRWTGDIIDLHLWHEYELATKGHQRITYSKGLKAILAVEDHTDEEVAAEEVGGQDVAVIPLPVWRRIVAVPGLACQVKEAAEAAGLVGINALLERHGVGLAHAPPDQAMRAAVINLAPLLQPGCAYDTRLP